VAQPLTNGGMLIACHCPLLGTQRCDEEEQPEVEPFRLQLCLRPTVLSYEAEHGGHNAGLYCVGLDHAALVDQVREHLFAGLWIRIDSIRIRIQHFCSIRIQFRIRFRIQAKIELLKTIFFSNFFEIKIESNQIKNTGFIHQIFFSKSS
jgi:hypothetical protein